jgi:hypothetical protein
MPNKRKEIGWNYFKFKDLELIKPLVINVPKANTALINPTSVWVK